MKKVFHNRNKSWSIDRMKHYIKKNRNIRKNNEYIIILIGSVISILVFVLAIAMFLKNRNKKSELEEEIENDNIEENEIYYLED